MSKNKGLVLSYSFELSGDHQGTLTGSLKNLVFRAVYFSCTIVERAERIILDSVDTSQVAKVR